MKKSTDEVYALKLDDQDPLVSFRERFVIDDPDLIYLDGNSLGRLPRETIPHIQNLVENQWRFDARGSAVHVVPQPAWGHTQPSYHA